MSRERVAMRLASGSVKVINPYVYLDVTINGVAAGRLIFELRADVLPKTCENFRLLCRGQSFQGNNKQKLCFRGCSFTRIAPGEVCQSGDVVGDSGSDGECVYEGSKCFADEKFIFKHMGRGLLSMVNDGPNRNTSRFFITLGKQPLLDGKHVVFGFCCHGDETLALIEKCGEPHSGRPLRKVVISQCGELVNPAEYSMPFLNMDEAQPKSSKTSGTGLSLPGGSTSTTDPEVSTADRDDVERRERAALEEKSVRKQQAKQKQRSRVK